MNNQVHELESLSVAGNHLIVRLRFVDDRFVTDILLASESETHLVLHSVEGASAEIWPPSGPLQEVLPQDLSSGPCLTGIGRAGKGHWSTVITSDPGSPAIEFDFAGRVKESPSFLGSTYQILGDRIAGDPVANDISIAQNDSSTIRCGNRILSGRVLTGEGQHDPEQDRFVFGPGPASEPFPVTLRWQYRFELA